MGAPRMRNGAQVGCVMREYKTKAGVTQFAPSEAELMEMEENDEGFCLACGATQECVEPDAVRYECDCCGKPKVYGWAEIVLMGLVKD